MTFNKQSKSGRQPDLSGDGLGEAENFLNQENHVFINKLNYICKNYDSSFKDVSSFSQKLTFTLMAGQIDETALRRPSLAPSGEIKTSCQ